MLNMVYLPMSFLSGLWIPLSMLPHVLQQVAPIWPSYHLDMLALAAVGLRGDSAATHLLVLAGFTGVFLLLAIRRLHRHG
jgi:ABC-2 type transport system permease protein